MAKGLWNGGEGEGGVAPRGCPWEPAEDPQLGGREIGGALVGRAAFGPKLWSRKEVSGRVSGSPQRGRGQKQPGGVSAPRGAS